jgi:hypothetical protein
MEYEGFVEFAGPEGIKVWAYSFKFRRTEPRGLLKGSYTIKPKDITTPIGKIRIRSFGKGYVWYELDCIAPPNLFDGAVNKYFNQIIDSFKAGGRSTEEKWITYTNSKYNFSFEDPSSWKKTLDYTNESLYTLEFTGPSAEKEIFVRVKKVFVMSEIPEIPLTEYTIYLEDGTGIDAIIGKK